MKIGVVSDTHLFDSSRLPQELLQGLQGVDLILHAGDLVVEEVLDALKQIAPVEAVAGNNEDWHLYAKLGSHKVITIGQWRIGLTHGHDGRGATTLKRALSNFTDVHCVVFGHSHIPFNERIDGVLAFNPGSAVQPRRQPKRSFGYLYVTERGLRGEHVFF